MNTKVYPLLFIWAVSFIWIYIYVNNNLLLFEILLIWSGNIYNHSGVLVLIRKLFPLLGCNYHFKSLIKPSSRTEILHASSNNLDHPMDAWKKDLWFLTWPVTLSRASTVLLHTRVLGAFEGKLFWPVLSMAVPEALMWTKSHHLKILLRSVIQQTCNEQS